MMFVMLVAAIGLVLAGLLAIAYGIGVQLSTGNTLIVAGMIGVCTGMIMLGFWMTVRELKNIARRLGAGVPEAGGEAMVRQAPPVAATRDSASGGGFQAADQLGGSGPFPPAPPPAFSPAAPPPWQNEAVLRDHPIPEPMHPEPPPSASKPKRNLLFSSTSRKERERAQARSSEMLPPDLLSSDLRPRSSPIVPPVETAELPPASFDDAWPKPERARPGENSPQRRSGRMPPTLAEANGGPALSEDQPEVTVLKSGVVDGMAYSLYSDGSIEGQMPEGMMRFASIDELRAHLDQRL